MDDSDDYWNTVLLSNRRRQNELNSTDAVNAAAVITAL